jgi:hypothetical protein
VSGMDQQMLNAWDNLFSALERETLACLKNLESMSAQEIERFVEKRQEILAAIQKFDTSCNPHPGHSGWSDDGVSLKTFRQRQTALLSRVIKADGLLLALAEMGLASFRAQLADISQGRGALHGYREESGIPRSPLKRIA